MSEFKPLLTLLNKHSELLEDAYNQGSKLEHSLNQDAAQELLLQRLVYVTSEGFRLNPKLRGFFDSVLGKETSSYIDTAFRDRKKVILSQIATYSMAKRNHDVSGMENAFFQMTDEAFAAAHQAKEAVANLRRRADGEFSHVKQLEAKLKLNEESANIGRDVVEGLRQFGAEELLLAPNVDKKIYRFLKNELIDPILRCNSEMIEVLNKFAQNSIRFKEYSKSNELIRSFSDYWHLNPTFELPEYSEEYYSDQLFALTTPLIQNAVIDMDNQANEDFVVSTIDKLEKKHSKEPLKLPVKQAESDQTEHEIKEPNTETVHRNTFDKDFRAFMRFVLEEQRKLGHPISATKYYNDNALPHALDHWLFGITMCYYRMSDTHQAKFKLKLEGKRRYGNEGNLILEEVLVEDSR
ncbi:hypothetical protein [Vibrio harveyi]|uniref:hypothetical protein n=1 Tax=Vibrio harveyi TaxID=669 RepID=UPI003CEAEAEC